MFLSGEVKNVRYAGVIWRDRYQIMGLTGGESAAAVGKLVRQNHSSRGDRRKARRFFHHSQGGMSHDTSRVGKEPRKTEYKKRRAVSQE